MSQIDISLYIHPNARSAIDEAAASMLPQLKAVVPDVRSRHQFESRVPKGAIIDVKQVSGIAELTEQDYTGIVVRRLLYFEENSLELDLSTCALYDKTLNLLSKVAWIRGYLHTFTVKHLLSEWLVACHGKSFVSLCDYIAKKTVDLASHQEVLVPIAFLEIEDPIQLGDAAFVPVTTDLLAHLKQHCIDTRPNDGEEDVEPLFKSFESRMTGLAAVRVKLFGESSRVIERAITIARDAIGLLRLFSPACCSTRIRCPCDLLGCEIFPKTLAIASNDKGFESQESNVFSGSPFWQISKAAVTDYESSGLNELGCLLHPADLTDFQLCVRGAILAFSKGLTLEDLSDRIVYAFSALESLLLKHNSEPLQQNVGERMAFIIAQDLEARQSVLRNVKQAYKIRSKYIHHRSHQEDDDVMEVFFFNTTYLLRRVLLESQKVPTKLEFLDAIDEIKFG